MKVSSPAKLDPWSGRRRWTWVGSSGVEPVLYVGRECLAGLFSTLATTGPVTSDGLATAAGLDERYVREWLGAMTVGRIVEHDPDAASYWLDAAHAALLTDDGVANIAAFTQYVSVLGGVEDDLLTCFREGGGVPYSRYPRFQEVMAADSGQTVLGALQPTILPLVPGLTERLESGIDVLDVGCGRGLAMMQLAEAFPNSRFTGLDLSHGGDRTRSAATPPGLPNLEFVVADATGLGSVWTHAELRPDHHLRRHPRPGSPDGDGARDPGRCSARTVST